MRGVSVFQATLLRNLLMFSSVGVLVTSTTQDQTDSCNTPHLALIGQKFHTITEGEELSLSCNLVSPPTSQGVVTKFWYLQLKDISDPIDTDSIGHHHPNITFNYISEGSMFNLTIGALTAEMEHVMVQCSAQVGEEPERFSKGMFMINILPAQSSSSPNTDPHIHSTTTSGKGSATTKPHKNMSNDSAATAGNFKKNTDNCTLEVTGSSMEMMLLTTAMCACLIINTVTLFMVVIVLCRIRKRENHVRQSNLVQDKQTGENDDAKTDKQKK